MIAKLTDVGTGSTFPVALATPQPDRGNLAFGQHKTDAFLDPRQGLVRIDPGPRQRAVCWPHKPFGNGALRAIKTS
jgi:hypothetical protein